jgi:hypothetical protein
LSGEVRDSGGGGPYDPTPPTDNRPSPAEQIRFIANIERLLADGSFVASYKYALLVSLVDLAIERGGDYSAELTLPVPAIAEKFIEVYWRQSVPYVADEAGTGGVLLHQNKGTQAKAVLLLAQFRAHASTLPAARRSRHWATLVRRFARLLGAMPLWKLQRIGHEYVEFLYRRGPQPDEITLLPGVASHLRQRAPLIRRLAQTEWLAFLLARSQNRPVLGNAVGLSEFMFGNERAALGLRLAKPLASLQDDKCFYCRERASAPVVDHFIPWSLYPRDLAHNFVAAHAACNSRKSNLLGGELFLGQWAEFVDRRDADLSALGSEFGLLVDRPTSMAVARWSYEQAEQAGAEVWLGGTEYGKLSPDWSMAVQA